MPRFALVTTVRQVDAAFTATVASVRAQSFEDWSWSIVFEGDAGGATAVTELVGGDQRIRVSHREPDTDAVVEFNDRLASTDAEFLVLLGDDGALAADALSEFDSAIEPTTDILYADEQLLDDLDVPTTFLKPDWSPERLRNHFYLSELALLRTELVRRVGGYRAGVEGVEAFDLVLRVAETASGIVHIARPLWSSPLLSAERRRRVRSAPVLAAWSAGTRAVADHLERVGIEAAVTKGVRPGFYTVFRAASSDISVSVVISTRGDRGRVRGVVRPLVVNAVRTLLAASDFVGLEVIVVYAANTPFEVLEQLRALESAARIVLLAHEGPDSAGARNNAGFLRASGDYLVFLHDDTEALSEQPLEDLIAPLREPDVGATGARLLAESMLHDSVGIVHYEGVTVPAGRRLAYDDAGPYGVLSIDREVSALDGVLAMTRGVFERVGGFSADVPDSYGEFDLSFKIRSAGLRLVWLHGVSMFHFAVGERDAVEAVPSEWSAFQDRWASVLPHDRFGLQP